MLQTEISKTLKDLFVPNPSLLMTPPSSRNPETGELGKLSLLFLDVDGVLNGHTTQVLHGMLAGPNSGERGKGYVDDAHATDPIAAQLINKLCETTGSWIVLSSSWRIGMTMDQIPTMLETLGINKDLVIGRTDTIHNPESPRGNQIQRFIDRIITREGQDFMFKYDMLARGIKFEDKVVVQSYAIVDDDGDMLESQKANFVQTTYLDGLKLSHVLELGKILSNDETYHLNRLSGGKSVGHELESKFH